MKVLIEGSGELGVQLKPAQIDLFEKYYDTLIDWNTRINLTSVIGREDVQRLHFLDSLSVSQAIPRAVLESGRFADVGSGAGFPGIPLAIAFPGLHASLIESTGKKATFISALIDELDLSNASVLNDRAETLAHDPKFRESFDFVVTRAVGSMAVVAELTLPLCKPGGLVIVQKKTGVEVELSSAHRAIETVGGEVTETKEIHIQGLTGQRCLVVLKKVAPTPARYPRRPGMPKKRPL